MYQETLRIRREAYGDEHLDVAASLNSIGLVLFKMDLHEMAMQSFHHCLNIRVRLLGRSHRDVAIILYNIATVHLELGDEDDAVRYYRETLKVEQDSLGKGHQDVLLTMQHIATVHQQRGELEEALKYFRECLDVQLERYHRLQGRKGVQHDLGQNDQSFQESSIHLARTWNHIGNLHLQRGDTTQMMQSYSEASRVLRHLGESEIELSISGFNYYMLSKIHPECARAA